MKYIVIKSYPLGTEAPIIFPEYVGHADVAHRNDDGKWYVGPAEVVSAGSLNIDAVHNDYVDDGRIVTESVIKVQCSGNSYIMNIYARKNKDSILIEQLLRIEY